jgi:hypothetical protein
MGWTARLRICTAMRFSIRINIPELSSHATHVDDNGDLLLPRRHEVDGAFAGRGTACQLKTWIIMHATTLESITTAPRFSVPATYRLKIR